MISLFSSFGISKKDIKTEYCIYDDKNNIIFKIYKVIKKNEMDKYYFIKEIKNKYIVIEISDKEKEALFGPYWKKYYYDVFLKRKEFNL